MIIELYTFFYIYAVWVVGILEKDLRGIKTISFIVPLNIVIAYYAYFMFKGVRDESKLMMFCLYFGNIFQAIFLYYVTVNFCYVTQKPFSLRYCFKYGLIFDIFWSLTIITMIILILSTWNSIRCQRNFGMNLGFYLRYEPTPEAFKNLEKVFEKSNSEAFKKEKLDSEALKRLEILEKVIERLDSEVFEKLEKLEKVFEKLDHIP
ncbi:hypothetical protein GLOIN_2v1501867 [Rhizophagus clarus]|uniref:Uncharacterized protein n=1 Tax=Rhizophagus clarus TaxID=94130 RepID=A0A8H3M3W2_9GLOM|nr:hypothetical protein GLOIN_2v1501867 [Rhizophagus clarus]